MDQWQTGPNPANILVTLTCRAIGLPVPLINWRKNGQHLPDPPKVTSTSVNGLGTLTIFDVGPNDQANYSCEAINSKESQLAPHETILIVKRKYSSFFSPLFHFNF